jgi:hypothetical protein
MMHTDNDGFTSLFDGVTLDGWHAVPRVYGRLWPGGPRLRDVVPELPADYAANAAAHPAVWSVVDGAIEGRQDPARSGYGGYLVSDRAFGDFELELEMNPDWPADTGVMLRRRPDDWAGFQVLVDHRKSGSIGGFYGNGVGGFHAVPFVLDASVDADGRPDGLIEEDPTTSLEPVTADKAQLLSRAGDVQAFLKSWRWADWNHLRVICVGRLPTITTWVNGQFVAELDTATITHPHFDADAVAELLGPTGHIAFEVHDNDPTLGTARRAPGARCRWRNIKIRALS